MVLNLRDLGLQHDGSKLPDRVQFPFGTHHWGPGRVRFSFGVHHWGHGSLPLVTFFLQMAKVATVPAFGFAVILVAVVTPVLLLLLGLVRCPAFCRLSRH
jgi:hypothetical protein